MTQTKTPPTKTTNARWANEPDRFSLFAEESMLSKRERAVTRGLAHLSLMLLYGFLLAGPKVPFLAWGEPAGIITALVAVGAALAVGRVPAKLDFMLTLTLFGCVGLIARAEFVSTSLLVVGAFVTGVVRIARRHPSLYGVVAGVLVWGLLMRIFSVNPFGQAELFLSGEAFSHDGYARQALLLAAVTFLAGIQHLAVSGLRREQERAEAAERAAAEAGVFLVGRGV